MKGENPDSSSLFSYIFFHETHDIKKGWEPFCLGPLSSFLGSLYLNTPKAALQY